MTTTSLEELTKFLDLCDFGPNKGSYSIADYGGNEDIGSGEMKKLLGKYGLKHYYVLDLSTKVDLLKKVKGPKHHIGICMDLLEHVSNPFTVAGNIKDNLRKGAYLYVTVPWVWPVHNIPGKYSDYWRFTPDGLEELFSGMGKVALYAIRDSYKPNFKIPEAACAPELPYSRIIGIFTKL